MAKKPKRMTRKELRAPDPIEVRLQEMWDKMIAFRKILLGLLVVLVGGGGALALWNSAQASSRDEASEDLRTAMAPFVAPRGDAPEGEEAPKRPTVEDERFADEAAALKAAASRLEPLVDKYGAGSAASLALGNARLQAGESKAAADSFSAWRGAMPGTSLDAAVLGRLANAQARAGDKAAAMASLDALVAESSGMPKVMALMAKGDLDNPMWHEAGSADAARAAYKAAREELGTIVNLDDEDPLARFSQPYIVTELMNRLDFIE